MVPISPDIAGLFREWKGKQPAATSSDPVLPWPYDHLDSIYDDWHAVQKAAGIPDGRHYVPKNCRSTCASGLIAANVPTIVVKDFLGHQERGDHRELLHQHKAGSAGGRQRSDGLLGGERRRET